MEYLTVSKPAFLEALNKRLGNSETVTIVDLFETYVDVASAEIDMLPKNDLKGMIFKQFKHYSDFDATVMESAKAITAVKDTTENVIMAIDRKDTVSLKHAYNELKKYQKRIGELEEEMFRDEQTGLLNRKYLFANKLQANYLFKSSGAMFVLSVSDFETLNAQYGHKTGDSIIALFAKTMTKNINDANVEFIRYTGNNFILLTPEANASALVKKLKAIQAFFRAKKFKVLHHDIVQIGFEFTQYNYAKDDSFDTVLNKAKKQLDAVMTHS